MKYVYLLMLSYVIGSFVFTVDGATVQTDAYCQDGVKVTIHKLTATDAQERWYWLGFYSTEVATVSVSHTGMVKIEGTHMYWGPHATGDEATLSIRGEPCERAVLPPQPRYRIYLPLAARGDVQ